MPKHIAIVGGGVIGLSAAWYCQRRGHQVTLIDRNGEVRNGCSFGNAGMIVPSHFVPLAAPGMVRLGLKWMWNSESPFYIRPRASWDLLAWLWRFTRACSTTHVQRSAPLLRDLHLTSRDLFQSLASDLPDEFGLTPNGLLMLCRSEHALREEVATSKLASQLGVDVQVLDSQATADLDPNIEMDVRGSVYYPRDCHLSPNRLMLAMQSDLAEHGCRFHWETECNHLRIVGNRVTHIETTAGPIECDEAVICGGIWSSKLSSQLGISLPMQAGKGYSLTLEHPAQQPSICSILTEARVAVTPMGSALRFGGTMEIAGIDESISNSRVRGIIQSIPQYFPRFQAEDFHHSDPWVGLRPCSPDGLPYLGRPKSWENVVVSTGHAMMGISLAAVSGSLVVDFIDHARPKIADIELLSPDRYS